MSVRGEAHVWVLPLDSAPPLLHSAATCLSPEERARAGRILDPLMKERFRLTRAALRLLLGASTGIEPADLMLGRTQRGKPVLAGARGIDFSISHSRGLAVLATAMAPVGVDVEHVREPKRAYRTAQRLLHADTVAQLEALQGEERVRAFLDAWTLREAHVKAVGGGLFHTPDTLPFDAAYPADARLREVRGRDGSVWSIARFDAGRDARAALALLGVGHTLRVHDAEETLERIAEIRGRQQ